MALHELNLWNMDSRTGSSLDVTAKYGGLRAGRIDLPEMASKAKGFKVRIGGKATLESYTTLAGMVTAIGGSVVSNLTGPEKIIEFDTSTSNTGARGIYAVEGVFVRDWHPNEALTKGEAMKLIDTHGVDTYLWKGTEDIAASTNKNLLSLNGLGTELTLGVTTLNATSLVILPVAEEPRGIIVTVRLDGEYEAGGTGYQDFRVQLQAADGTTPIQTVPLFVPNKRLDKSTAVFVLYTNGVHDELSTTGFKLAFLNDSNAKVTLSEVNIAVQNISNPDFTRK